MKKLLWMLFVGASLAHAQERMLVEKVEVAAGPAEVFAAWTTTDGVKTFFAPDAHIELRVDGPYEIFFNPLAKPGLKGADGMRVIGFQQDRMLSFTWNAPPHLPAARQQRTHVTVRLTPHGDHTQVTLTHAGWGDGGEWDQAYDYFGKAWKMVLGNLQRRFASGPIDWSDWMARLRAAEASGQR